MIAAKLTDESGFLTPYGVQRTEAFAHLTNWQPFPAALPFTDEQEQMTPAGLLWLTQASTQAGLPAPVTRGATGFAILLAVEGVV